MNKPAQGIIKPPTASDIPTIYQLYQRTCLDRNRLNSPQYQAKLEKQGFLLGAYTINHHYDFLTKAKAYLVCGVNKQIFGYIVGRNEITYEDDRYRAWHDLKLKKLYYQNPKLISITGLVVDTNKSRQGIGSYLLATLEAVVKKQGFQFLASTVTTSPITNYPSLKFHLKNGFGEISTSQPRYAFNLPNYASSLFLKRL